MKARIQQLMSVKVTKSVDSFHRELGMLVWDECGMSRTREGLLEALEKIPKIREAFWKDVIVPGSADGTNMELEKAWRVADFIDFAEIMCHDALDREESCGGHFREEFQFTAEDEDVKNGYTNAGEAMRRDDEFCYVAAWEFKGPGVPPVLHKEPLEYEAVELSVRSYK